MSLAQRRKHIRTASVVQLYRLEPDPSASDGGNDWLVAKHMGALADSADDPVRIGVRHWMTGSTFVPARAVDVAGALSLENAVPQGVLLVVYQPGDVRRIPHFICVIPEDASPPPGRFEFRFRTAFEWRRRT